MADIATAVATQPQAPSLIAKFAGRFGVEPNKMMTTLKATAFRGDVSNEQMMALLIVADQYNLNPWTKEIYAFPDKNNGIVPVIGIDGWARIINEHPQFDGVEFTDGPAATGDLPAWIECSIFRKDREHATKVREYMAECKRDTGPWRSHPRRMLRHKSMIQAARIAFSFVGVYDEDEAQRIIEGVATVVDDSPAVAEINAAISGTAKAAKPKPAPRAIESEETNNDDRPPLALDGDALPAASYAEIMDRINAAADPEAIEAAVTLIAGIPAEAQRAELDVAARAKRKQINAALDKAAQ